MLTDHQQDVIHIKSLRAEHRGHPTFEIFTTSRWSDGTSGWSSTDSEEQMGRRNGFDKRIRKWGRERLFAILLINDN